MKFLYVVIIGYCLCLPVALAGGTEVGGGGNLINGRTIESYIVDPTVLPEFKDIERELKTLRLADRSEIMLDWVVLKKTWYLVPGPLANLPPGQVGPVATSEQAAVQNSTSVWIDQDLFQKMSTDQKSELLVHEIVMGFRLFKIESSFERCIQLNAWRSDVCQSLSRVARGAPNDFTVADYDAIRSVTRALIGNPPQTPKALFELLYFHGFSTATLSFDPAWYMTGTVPRAADLIQAMSTLKLSNNWPNAFNQDAVIDGRRDSYGGEPEIPLSPTGKCHFDLQVAQNKKSFVLLVRNEGQAPLTVRVKDLESGLGENTFSYNVDERGRSIKNLVPVIGQKFFSLAIWIKDVGIEHQSRYLTQAQFSGLELTSEVMVDAYGNSANLPGQSVFCTTSQVWPEPQP